MIDRRTLEDLDERMVRAVDNLKALEREYHDHPSVKRLRGKREGVELARSYLRDLMAVTS